MSFGKYITATKVSWQAGFVYRLNFVMWRVRMVIQLLALYFLWLAITSKSPNAFGYDQATMLVYVLGSSVMRALVFSSRSIDVQGEISNGDLNNYLIKPLNYFRYWFFRDFADKALNIIFSIGELVVLFLLLRPPVIIQSDPLAWLGFLVMAPLAMILYYYFSLLISMTTFWYPEGDGWPQRFFVFTILESLSGGLFPLDILPAPVYSVLQNLPTAYFIFVPMQVYLGRIQGMELVGAIGVTVFWVLVLWWLARVVWHRGLKVYGAYGR